MINAFYDWIRIKTNIVICCYKARKIFTLAIRYKNDKTDRDGPASIQVPTTNALESAAPLHIRRAWRTDHAPGVAIAVARVVALVAQV